MKVIGNTLLALVRPAKGIDGLGAAVKWLWIPLAVLLVASVLIKTTVTAPLMIAAEEASRDKIIAEQTKDMPEEEKAKFERDMAQAEQQGPDVSGVVLTASIVFGTVGALAAILVTALFFFVAAKTSANPVGFGAVLSVASLSYLPHAVRNIVQTISMSASGVWLQHAGMSSLVVPADPNQTPPVLLYSLLSQVDIWVVWGLAILFGGLLSATVGFPKKRAITTVVAFVVVALLVKVVPMLLSSFLGGNVSI